MRPAPSPPRERRETPRDPPGTCKGTAGSGPIAGGLSFQKNFTKNQGEIRVGPEKDGLGKAQKNLCYVHINKNEYNQQQQHQKGRGIAPGGEECLRPGRCVLNHLGLSWVPN